jgi:alpha-1,6-mannosyltransferase
MLTANSSQLQKWSVAGCIICLHIFLLYFIPRSNFAFTAGVFLLLFSLYFFVIKREQIFSFKFCIVLAIILRVIAVFSYPALSDDHFRFIWDGKMTLMHINPFQFTPEEYLQTHPGNSYLKHLFGQMNSQEYHTVYPPVMQYIFTVAALIGKENNWIAVIIMKLFIAAAEIGTMRFLYLSAQQNMISKRNMLWYILNPLIIIELCGNVHFEAVLIFFFAGFLYYLHKQKLFFAALFFMLAVCTKMIPLMLAPLIIRHLGFKKAVSFGLVALAVGLLLFLPFLDKNLITGMSDSLRLFFHLFEFNASVFYFIRWAAYFFVDYDIIEEVAPVLGIITFIIIMLISFWPAKKTNFIEKCLWIFSVYFLFSTMVHPWYIAILIFLSALSRFKFPLIFSVLIILSYFPYSMSVYNEDNSLWLIAIEYGLLFIFIGCEIYFHNNRRIVKNNLFSHNAI